VGIDGYRVDERRRKAAFVFVEALAQVPAEVGAGRRAGGEEVDLLPLILTDVGDEEVSRSRVEREPPGIAQPGGPDLRAAPCGGEWIGGRNGVRMPLSTSGADLA
jgi:hypothetical protein